MSGSMSSGSRRMAPAVYRSEAGHLAASQTAIEYGPLPARGDMPPMKTTLAPLLAPLCAALILLPASSFAAPASSDGSYTNDEGATVTVREVVIDDGDSIEGEILSAEGKQIRGTMHDRHKSLISLRAQFTAQLIALSNDI